MGDKFEDNFPKRKMILEGRAGIHIDWALIYAFQYAFHNEIDVDLIHNDKITEIRPKQIRENAYKESKKSLCGGQE
jgi:hypothetical protein